MKGKDPEKKMLRVACESGELIDGSIEEEGSKQVGCWPGEAIGKREKSFCN